MSQRMEIPITTLADGTCAVVINPLGAFYTAYLPNSDYLPFVQVSPTSSTNPYTAVSAYNVPGPFLNQLNNVVTFAPDYIFCDYINTEAAIQCKGRF